MNGRNKKTIISSNKWWFWGLACIILIAVFCRYVSWEHFAWTKGGVPFSDSRALDMWAINILDGIGFRSYVGYWLYEAFRMPFFSVFLASIYNITGYDYVPARILLCGFSVATCLGLAGIGRLLFNRWVGFIAGLLCALYYPLIFYSHALMTETLAIFLFVLGVYALLRSLHERSWGFAVCSGIALGLAGMTRFSVFAAVPVLFLYSAAFPCSWPKKIKTVFLWGAFLCIAFSPWLVRNAMVFETFFPSGSGGSRMLWNGANPKYGGTTFSVQAWRDMLWEVPDASELERTKRVKKEFAALVKEHPQWYLEKVNVRANQHLQLPKWKTMWKVGGLYRYWTDLSILLAAYLGSVGFFLAVIRKPRSGLLVAGMFGSLLTLHSLAGEAVRYRLAVEWIWLLGAAYLLSCLGQLITHPLLEGQRSEDKPIHRSLFDRSIFKWAVPTLLILPFLLLAMQIPSNSKRKSNEQLPKLTRPVEEVLKSNGLLARFREQKSVLHDISHYRSLAFRQDPDKVSYPRDVVIFAGELTHIVTKTNGRISDFSFNVNKAGLDLGNAQLICTLDKKVSLLLPEKIQRQKRTQGIVVGTILKSGPLGDFVLSVSDIIVDGRSLKG